jgi:DNA-binding transcriptional regulator YhcF (GntR family)
MQLFTSFGNGMKPDNPTTPRQTQGQQVLQTLRDLVVSGQFEPGSRLPSFGKLEAQLHAGRTVIQQAVESLKHEGFITSIARKGLYVAPCPPHLGRYALVFPCFPSHAQWSRFHDAMLNEARRMTATNPVTHFVFYEGINDERHGGDVLGRLLEQIRLQRLAGLILLPETHDLIDDPRVRQNGIPYVMVDGERGQTPRPQICTDVPMLLERGLECLKNKRRKRIAMLMMADTFAWLTPDHFTRCGVDYRQAWVQRVGRSHPQTVGSIVHLLMDYPARQRPDGLFIADDNLVETASAALVELGLRVGHDLDVVAHCNWPWPVQSVLPMQRIGFHAGQLLQSCLQVLDTVRLRGKDDRILSIPALLESEVLAAEVSQSE